MEQSTIEYMLSVLSMSAKDSGDINLSFKDQLTGLHPVLQSHIIHAADTIKAFADEMPGGFFIYHADGNEEIIYVNNALLRIFGCDSLEEFKELTGNSFRGIVHPEDLAEVEQSIHRQIDNSQHDLDYVEYRIVRRDGEIRWLEDYGHFVHSPSVGDIFYVFVSDATDKKKRQMAEKAEITQEQLRRLEVIEGLSVNYETILYVNLDADKVQSYRLSERTRQQFEEGCSKQEYLQFISDYVDTWVYPDDRDSFTKATDPDNIRKKLSDNKTYYLNYRSVFEGEMQYLQLRIVNVGSADHISQIVMGARRLDDEIKHEMMQKKLLEDALNHAKLANATRSTFLSNMSHDMRTPLNAITGFTALAKKNVCDPEKVESYLERIDTASVQLLSLIDSALEISWMESGNIHVKEDECNLHEIMQEVHNIIVRQAAAKNITLSLNLDGLRHSDILSDRDQLIQLLSCLTSNAVKYTNTGGKINITAAEINQSADNYMVYQFIVEDNGIGIGEEFREHIFEPFERERNTTLSGIHGTGLGLTIVKKIVDLMGGHIEVDSRPGEGSKFTVMLSLRIQDSALDSSDGDKSAAAKEPGQQRILLVEDNEINREIETELLQAMGFIVDTAEDGSVAVQKVMDSEPGKYSLILMDIQMPVMDGYQATRAIRKLENLKLASIPIIAVSSNAFKEDRQRSRDSGMNAHIAKPVNYTDLLELILKITSP